MEVFFELRGYALVILKTAYKFYKFFKSSSLDCPCFVKVILRVSMQHVERSINPDNGEEKIFDLGMKHGFTGEVQMLTKSAEDFLSKENRTEELC